MADQPQSKSFTRLHFMQDMGAGLFGFLYLARYVRFILLLWVLVAVGYRLFAPSDAKAWKDVIGLPVLVLLGYALAGLSVALSLFLLRPVRRWFFGWLITGYVLAFAIYGSVGLVGVLGYVWFGINLFDFTDPADAWDSILSISLLLGWVGVPTAVWFYFKRDR